jgi:hypothetical protein
VHALSNRFLIINVAAAVALAVVPFRYIFAAVVVDVFTTRFQAPGGMMSRMLAAVPLSVKRAAVDRDE